MSLTLCERVLAAYGGRPRWQAASAVEAQVSASGWAFRLKLQPPDRNIRVQAAIGGKPGARYAPAGRHGEIAVLEGQHIRLEDSSGALVAERDDPKRFFPYGRRALWWDQLDRTYFSAYALWNYLTFPALMLRSDIQWTELPGARMEAVFPASIPTHSARQVFYFDPETGLLLRHDYTAEVFGSWARAANVVLEHGSWEGIPFPSHRRVTPVGAGERPMAAPVLVDIHVHSWRLTTRDTRRAGGANA